MTKTTNQGDIAEGIERLVREYITTIHVTAKAAVDRAFAAGIDGSAAANGKQRRRSAAPATSPRAGKRRASDEIGTLSERLYEAVCRAPGETMTALAPGIGATVRELHRPMTLLKRAGRVRCAGTRHATRYFPMAREGQRPSV
jgi:hypothetical protein